MPPNIGLYAPLFVYNCSSKYEELKTAIIGFWNKITLTNVILYEGLLPLNCLDDSQLRET